VWRFRIVACVEVVASPSSILPEKHRSRRRRVSTEGAIKAFFGSNALVAIVVLALITIFLFREASILRAKSGKLATLPTRWS